MYAARSPRCVDVSDGYKPFMPVTAPPSVVPVSAELSASRALAKLIVPAAPCEVARLVMLFRILVRELTAAELVVEWQLAHCGEVVVLKSCAPAFESPVVCAPACMVPADSRARLTPTATRRRMRSTAAPSKSAQTADTPGGHGASAPFAGSSPSAQRLSILLTF